MLDVETKRRIDTARDILVGKVPDPKSQVEQITIALIYKFMDDMDAEAEELGGERTFFKGEFERYGWTKLMAPNMGGFDVISLYSESIQKMNENPNIPQLFRDIFKNAYLPYRDPETLKSFLKIINAFSYDHSEKLGDAFEYLLSVLGSQGEAGQFRTPRHIIDFMVEVIEPRKNESILDPACGTAGFLISSYKHIRKHNSSSFKPEADREAFDEKGVNIEELTLDSPKNYRGDLLTPDDRARLSGNISGLDISPDMVRLSLVNMYLHGFTEPHIYEYDALTSEERWNEFYDIILANPPFMSPKGGIKPHKRFSVQSNRSEVLFVDYIAEHITPTGRAAVIVPEGIIFQSGTAYKQLRKMLVDKYLFAVVSLPAGVFNPYSGVKTSILFMDKSFAKKTDNVLFVKIDNDGFGLGAQRRPIDRNDLPEALKAIRDYRAKVANGEVFEVEKWANVLVVEKERVTGSGEYYLAGDRYKEAKEQINHKWPIVEMSEVAHLLGGFAFKSADMAEHRLSHEYLPVIKIGNLTKDGMLDLNDVQYHKYTSDLEKYKLRLNDILIAMTGATVGKVAVSNTENALLNQRVGLVRAKKNVMQDYLIKVLLFQDFYDYCQITAGGGAQGNISPTQIMKFKIPLPPMEVQKEIVAEIEGYQKIINGARQVVENYKPQIQIDPKWEMVELGAVCESIMDGTHFSPSNTETGDRLYITSKNVRENFLDLTNVSYISEEDHKSIYSRCPVRTGDVLYVKDGANTGLAAINTLTEEFSLLSSVAVLRGKPQILGNRYLSFFLNTESGRQSMLSLISGVAITRLTLTKLNAAIIPLPPLEAQQQIVARIEKEQELVNANKELIRIFEQKIKDRIAVVWGEE